ncbi:DNA/RNA helicase domain-containing protein [Companilactobacillus mishanensis]|uniref:DNA/RNA helicase domain-containing protein n=1 Tax=Companilactobacillus mishanensis TaxID=2486008 RepID=UPI001295F3B6|nr:DNA/RNA helicase domain-containing protein [Companilactobacillus mishanensis]MQS89717.1 DUF2075 domain-containing protein [Companilactobacillus mishanensis]
MKKGIRITMKDQREFSLLELDQILNESDETIHSFLKLHDCCYNFRKDSEQVDIKELKTYHNLIVHLMELNHDNQKLDGFFLGLKLNDQADTQFDLLKPSKDTIINFEFKKEMPKKGISKQVMDHYRFLKFVYPRPLIFEYIEDKDELYKYDAKSNSLALISYNEALNLVPLENTNIKQLEGLTRSDFLVSPYNQPDHFLKGQYELTAPQKDIKKKVLNCTSGVFEIKGGPGSGKTLLLLDILASERFQKNHTVGMIMGASPGQGQIDLANSLNIKLHRFYFVNDLSIFDECDVIVFDEGQRIPLSLIREAIALSKDKLIIINVDAGQVIHPHEKEENIQEFLDKDQKVKTFHLKKSIRINPKLDHFQKRLFDRKSKQAQFLDFNEVSVTFFKSKKIMNEYLDKRRNQHTKILEPDEYVTQGTGNIKHKHLYKYSEDVKSVIGQEFKDVIIIFNSDVKYQNNQLMYFGNEFYPYMEMKMFYQAITRASRSVEIIIYDNTQLYLEIQSILTATRDSKRKDNVTIASLQKQIHELKKKITSLSQNN